MAKPDSKKEAEQYLDAWSRFERAIDVVAKSPPQHRAKIIKQKTAKRIPKSKKAGA